MGVVCSIVNVKAKLEDQGMMCMLLGYSQNHMGGTNRMLNTHEKRIVLSREII